MLNPQNKSHHLTLQFRLDSASASGWNVQQERKNAVSLTQRLQSALVSELRLIFSLPAFIPLCSEVSSSCRTSATCSFFLLSSSVLPFVLLSLFLLQTRSESFSPMRPSGTPKNRRQTMAAACSANFFDFSLEIKKEHYKITQSSLQWEELHQDKQVTMRKVTTKKEISSWKDAGITIIWSDTALAAGPSTVPSSLSHLCRAHITSSH